MISGILKSFTFTESSAQASLLLFRVQQHLLVDSEKDLFFKIISNMTMRCKMMNEVKRKSLKGTIWKGFCPICSDDKEMYLNKEGCFECSQCHLRIGIVADAVIVMGPKGMGNFQTEDGGYISAVNLLQKPVAITYDDQGGNLCGIMHRS